VTEHEGQRVSRWHGAGGKPDVGVADSAARNLDDDLVVAGIHRRKGQAFEALPRGNQCEAVWGIEVRHHPALREGPPGAFNGKPGRMLLSNRGATVKTTENTGDADYAAPGTDGNPSRPRSCAMGRSRRQIPPRILSRTCRPERFLLRPP
jgi:hypothetical protein